MIQPAFPDPVYQQHKFCCVMSQCSDEGCDLDVRGWAIPPLTVIEGTTYQSIHKPGGPLCDFTLFGRSSQSFVCAIEMKGGHNLEAGHAIDQIQAGLQLAESMASNRDVDWWVPVLLRHPGSGSYWDFRLLLSNRSRVKFHGRAKTVEQHDCGCSLESILGFGP